MPSTTAPAITALILCGGQGSRMGGRDKGLQAFAGQPLALRALQRLRAQSLPPAHIAISANRHLTDYAAFGQPVWPDTLPGFAGPLAGMLTGLTHATTPLLLTVPCDVPHFPPDICQRLLAALQASPGASAASVAVADTTGPNPRLQPVFSLLHTRLRQPLADHLHSGGRKVAHWLARQGHALALYPASSAPAFANANTVADLQALQTQPPPAAP